MRRPCPPLQAQGRQQPLQQAEYSLMEQTAHAAQPAWLMQASKCWVDSLLGFFNEQILAGCHLPHALLWIAGKLQEVWLKEQIYAIVADGKGSKPLTLASRRTDLRSGGLYSPPAEIT